MKDFYIKEKQKYLIYKYNTTLGGSIFYNGDSYVDDSSDDDSSVDVYDNNNINQQNTIQKQLQTTTAKSRRPNHLKIEIETGDDLNNTDNNSLIEWNSKFVFYNTDNESFNNDKFLKNIKNAYLTILLDETTNNRFVTNHLTIICNIQFNQKNNAYIGIIKYKDTQDHDTSGNMTDYKNWIKFYNQEKKENVKKLIEDKVLHDTYIEIVQYNHKYFLFEYSKKYDIFHNETKIIPDQFIMQFLRKVFAIYNEGFRLNDLELRNLVYNENEIYFIDWFDLLSNIFDNNQTTIKDKDTFASVTRNKNTDDTALGFQHLYKELERVLTIIGITLEEDDTTDDTYEDIKNEEIKKEIIKQNIYNIFTKLSNNTTKINKDIQNYYVKNISAYTNLLNILNFINDILI